MRTLVLLACTAACSGSSEIGDVIAARQIPEAIRPDVAAIAQANNQFACDLYAKLAVHDGNLFVSPFSISTAMAMVDAGAAGSTDAELRGALHFTLPGERTHAAYGALLDSLDTGRTFGAYTLATADRLFGQRGLKFSPDFLATTKNDYGAELLPVDFQHDLEAARATINGWVADQTEHRITELFAPGELDPTTVLALVNAIVFQGTWEQRFDAGATANAPFQLAQGAAVQAPMMHNHGPIATAAIPGGAIGVLPFHGKDLSMVLALPERPDGLPAIEAALSADAIAQWIAAAKPDPEVSEVALPKFAITSAVDLAAVLEQLGITSAFDPQLADFSPIDGARNLYLQRVVHRAVLAVDERGGTAAAATGVGLVPTAATLFVADRPFVFFIYDHVTGSVLFLGRLADPTKSS
jgi:serpin B